MNIMGLIRTCVDASRLQARRMLRLSTAIVEMVRPILILLPHGSQAELRNQVMMLGVVVLAEESHASFQRFARWLTRHIDYPPHVRYAGFCQQLSDDPAMHPASPGRTCGVPSVQDHAAYGQQLVAVPLPEGRPEYDSLVIAMAGGGQKHLRTLRARCLPVPIRDRMPVALFRDTYTGSRACFPLPAFAC